MTKKKTKIIKPKYAIAFSGAAGGKTVKTGHNLAFEMGAAVAKAGHTLLSGATVGLPDRAAQGAKAAGGQSIGISPAASKNGHINKYRLPTEAYDFILYSGLDYVGRDLLLISSADAVVFLGGRLGTLHEFTICMEEHKPAGVLLGAGGTSEHFDDIMQAAGMKDYGAHRVCFDTDPVELIRKVETMITDGTCKECRIQTMKH